MQNSQAMRFSPVKPMLISERAMERAAVVEGEAHAVGALEAAVPMPSDVLGGQLLGDFLLMHPRGDVTGRN